MSAYGHKRCKSAVEVVEKTTFDKHTHGNITRDGKVSGVASPMLLITDAAGNIVASRTFNGDLAINGTLTAQRLAATGDATINGTLTAGKVIGAVYA